MGKISNKKSRVERMKSGDTLEDEIMPENERVPLKKKLKEKFIISKNTLPLEVEPLDEICNEGRISPGEAKEAARKRKRSSSSHNLRLDHLKPSAKKQKSVKSVTGRTWCTQCSREFDDSEFRRHNKIEHNLGCSFCHLMFVDVSSLSTHLKSHQAGETEQNSSRPPAKEAASNTRPAERKRSLSGQGLLEVREYWRCSHCQEVFPSHTKLETHQQRPHKHQCEVEPGCQRSFLAISDRLKHYYEAHNVKKQLVECPRCLEMIDKKSKPSHDRRSHEVSCPEDDCPVKSNAEGIWCHRIKKHNYGRCENQSADPVEELIEPLLTDKCSEPEDVTASHRHHEEELCDIEDLLEPEACLGDSSVLIENDETAEVVSPSTLVGDGKELKERIEEPGLDVLELLESEETCNNDREAGAISPAQAVNADDIQLTQKIARDVTADIAEERIEKAVVCSDIKRENVQPSSGDSELKEEENEEAPAVSPVPASNVDDVEESRETDKLAVTSPVDHRESTDLVGHLQASHAKHSERAHDDLNNSVEELTDEDVDIISKFTKTGTEMEQLIQSEALKQPPEVKSEGADGIVLEESKAVVGVINEIAVQTESVGAEVSLDREDMKLYSQESKSVKEAGKSVRKGKLNLQKLSEITKKYCKNAEFDSGVTNRSPSSRKRNSKSSEDKSELVKPPEEDDDYHADDEENEEENRRDFVGNNHSKNDEEKQSANRDIKHLEIVINEERHILNESTQTIVVSDDDENPRSQAVIVDKDPEEDFDDIDALLGDSSDEDDANQKSSNSCRSVSIVDNAPVIPTVVILEPQESKTCLSDDENTNDRHEIPHKNIFTEIHHFVQPIKCQLCQISFKRETSMLAHFKKDHDHPCSECQLKFTGEVFLAEHLQTFHNIKYCPGKIARRRSSEKSRKNQTSNKSKKEKSNSKRAQVRKVPNKKSSEDDDSICAQCNQHFQGTDAFERHINLDHEHSCLFQGCELSFTREYSLRLHQFEAHSLGTKPAPEEAEEDHQVQSPAETAASSIYSNQEEPSLLELDCSTCGQTFETFQEKKDHDKLHYTPEKLLSSQSIPGNKKSSRPRPDSKQRFECWKCKKTFDSREERSQHKAKAHAFRCEYIGCSRAYISQSELERHTTRRHQDSELKGFSCRDCGENYLDQKSLKVHRLQPHGFTCHVVGCTSKFETKPKLLQHLDAQHDIQPVMIDDQNSGYITTERSRDNIQIAEWALEWIKSDVAVSHLRKVMEGRVRSRRHNLFLNKRERESCSANNTSRLYQLSNPGFLGGYGQKDSIVINELMEKVFNKYFDEADPKLVSLGRDMAFTYSICVLFPETFIHNHQNQGKTRAEAESAFMEVEVDLEERAGLDQDVKEAVDRKIREERENAGKEEDSGTHWVDHSDLESEDSDD